jgi:hypothetical protein
MNKSNKPIFFCYLIYIPDLSLSFLYIHKRNTFPLPNVYCFNAHKSLSLLMPPLSLLMPPRLLLMPPLGRGIVHGRKKNDRLDTNHIHTACEFPSTLGQSPCIKKTNHIRHDLRQLGSLRTSDGIFFRIV